MSIPHYCYGTPCRSCYPSPPPGAMAAFLDEILGTPLADERFARYVSAMTPEEKAEATAILKERLKILGGIGH